MADESFKVVCRYDEALDAEAMTSDERDRFRETGDVDALKYLDGEQPTVWHCRRLRTSEMRDVHSQSTDAGRYEAAFARGLMRVEGKRVDGGRESWTRPVEGKPLNDRALDGFDPADVLEVGAAIYGRSVLGKGRPAAWPQPATSRLAVAALVFRRVEARTIAERTSARSSAPAEGAAPTPSSPASETSGPATVTAPAAASPST